MWGTAKLSSRRRSVSVTVDAEVDISISDVSSEDLIAELQERDALPEKLPDGREILPAGTFSETLVTILELLEADRAGEAELFVRRVLRPKWHDGKEAEAAYKAAMI